MTLNKRIWLALPAFIFLVVASLAHAQKAEARIVELQCKGELSCWGCVGEERGWVSDIDHDFSIDILVGSDGGILFATRPIRTDDDPAIMESVNPNSTKVFFVNDDAEAALNRATGEYQFMNPRPPGQMNFFLTGTCLPKKNLF